MAACEGSPNLCRLSPELLTLILSKLPAKTVLNVSETCRHLNKITFGCDVLWKRLCKLHFKVDLAVKLPFVSFFQIYQLIYKYRVILQNHTYGNYIPEYFYHWSLLLGSDRSFYSGFRYLINSRFRKTWDISKSEVAEVSSDRSSIYTSVKALKAKLGSEENFQTVLLQRCMRNQRKISQQYITASTQSRVLTLSLFIRDNPAVKPILMTKAPIPKFLPDFDELPVLEEYSLETLPRAIAFDFIKGHFHKSGFSQVKNYVKFSQMLEKRLSNKSIARNVHSIATNIYSRFQNCVKLRLVGWQEYIDRADEYFDRLEEIDQWEKGIKYKSKFYFNTDGLTEHEDYINYIMFGDIADLTSLQRHYEGLHNIRIWLVKNCWIDELLGPTLRHILEGKPCDIFLRKIYEEIHKLVTLYLESGQSKHFRKLIKKVWQHATTSLESKAKCLEQLREDLNNKNVSPLNDWIQDEASDTV